MPLSVKDGMGAWVKDFQDSNAPQFKGKSDKERREMAIAAYLSAKRGDRNESVEENVSAPQTAAHRRAMMGIPKKKKDEPPFTPDPPKPAAKNSDGTKTSPMSRATQLAKKARDAQKVKESVELDEMKANAAYTKAAKDIKAYAAKDGGIDKKDMMNFAADLELMGRAPNILQAGRILDRINKRFGGYDTDVRDRLSMYLKKHGLMEAVQVDELSKATHDKYQKAAFSNAALGMAKKRMGTMSTKDAYDNEKKRYAGIDRSKYLSRKMKEENLDELKKSTLGSYVKKASQDAASKAYGAASAAKDNRADQAGKDFSKSMKRLRGIDTATKKLAKEGVEEAKSFDQKFKDHLKFATSKSPAVQAYMKKRKADRDAAHAKQDPAAVKKNYGPAVIPPGTAYNKASKRGMNPSQAASAVSTAFKNRAKGGKLPK